MGIVAGCICYGLNIFVKSNFICLLVSIPIAAVVYLFAYLVISRPSESRAQKNSGRQLSGKNCGETSVLAECVGNKT